MMYSLITGVANYYKYLPTWRVSRACGGGLPERLPTFKYICIEIAGALDRLVAGTEVRYSPPPICDLAQSSKTR